MSTSWKEKSINLIGLTLGIIALIPDQYRVLAASVLLALIVFLVLSEFSDDLDTANEELTKLKEKLKIHEQLIDVKAEIHHLKELTRKR